MWGARGQFLPAAAMVGYGYDGFGWPLEAHRGAQGLMLGARGPFLPTAAMVV
jgi:hypothetical protein